MENPPDEPKKARRIVSRTLTLLGFAGMLAFILLPHHGYHQLLFGFSSLAIGIVLIVIGAYLDDKSTGFWPWKPKE